MRNAWVGTLNSVAPTLTGSRPGSFDGSDAQVGHSRYATSATAPVATTPAPMMGTKWPRRGLCHRWAPLEADESRVMKLASWRGRAPGRLARISPEYATGFAASARFRALHGAGEPCVGVVPALTFS